MRRKHAIAISALLALAGIAGTVALAKTVALGQSSSTPTASELHARAASLERAEAQLRSARDRMPPELPPLPTTPVVAGLAAGPAQSEATLVHRDTASTFAPELDDDAEHEYDDDEHDDDDEHEREYEDD